jgi:transglutaminase-like putative cysteine protease
MTEYVVRHRTTYKYGRDVAFSRLVAHLSPRTTPLQQTRDYELTIAPTPIHAFSRLDYFGNRTDWFTIDGAHDVLDVLAESRVTVSARRSNRQATARRSTPCSTLSIPSLPRSPLKWLHMRAQASVAIVRCSLAYAI